MAILGVYTPGLMANIANFTQSLGNPNFDSKYSGQARPGYPLRRIEFLYKEQLYKFKINPEEYTQSEPNRVTLTQTKGGAWLDAWGGGIIEITIKGTTGVHDKSALTNNSVVNLALGAVLGRDIDGGYRKFKELRNLFRQIYADAVDGKEITELLRFYNYTDNEFYYCYPKPDGITLYRSKSKPNIYQYSIGLYALRRIGEPEKTTITLGNPVKPTPQVTPEPKTPEKASGNPEKASGNPQKTSSTKNESHQGGNEAIVSKLTTFSQTDKVVNTTTKTKPNAYIIADAEVYAEELSKVIGGKGGRISPTTAYKCCSGITMQESGTVSNVKGFKCKDITTNLDLLHKTLQFIPKCSSEAYNLYLGTKAYSDEYLSTEYIAITGGDNTQRLIQAITLGTALDSTLLESVLASKNNGNIPRALYNQFKLIMLEGMVIYRDVYEIASISDVYSGISSDLTVSQITQAINNAESLSYYLKNNSNDKNRLEYIDICSSLREYCKLLNQINMDIISYM